MFRRHALIPYCFIVIYIVASLIMFQICCSKCFNSNEDSFSDPKKLEYILPPGIYPQVISPNNNLCKNINYLVVVHCRVTDVETRQMWRRLYGSLKKRYKFNIMFSLGMPKDESYQAEVLQEAEKYGDLQQADFLDTYRNLTNKHLSWMRYLNKHKICRDVPYIFRHDDFVVWNVEYASDYIAALRKMNFEGISCHWKLQLDVIRDKSIKWYVSPEEYPGDTFPRYCSGGKGHIMTQNDISRLLAFSYATPFFWIDDAYVTGILRKRSGVRIIDDNIFYSGPFRRHFSTEGSMSVACNKTEFESFFYEANGRIP